MHDGNTDRVVLYRSWRIASANRAPEAGHPHLDERLASVKGRRRLVLLALLVSVVLVSIFFGPSLFAPASDRALAQCSNAQLKLGASEVEIKWEAFPRPHWDCSSPDTRSRVDLGWWP